MPYAREGICCLKIENKMSDLQALDCESEACITEHPWSFLCAWTCGYYRLLLTKFVITMARLQLLKQELLPSTYVTSTPLSTYLLN